RTGIELILRVDAESTMVWCDLERIEKVFLNLLSNATKFTQPGGHVQVLVRDAGALIEVVVQDDGPGFPPEKADRIFERFFQIDMGGTRRYGGTGIGLALAKEIVELHGGRIWAESNAGARFTVELLRDREHFRPEVLDRRGPPRDVPAGARPDDHGLMDFAVRERPSLIVTDLMMPGIDGLELTRRLRADERTKQIPILMLTARGDLDDRLSGIETGVNAYLAKPFSPRELLTTARALMQKQS